MVYRGHTEKVSQHPPQDKDFRLFIDGNRERRLPSTTRVILACTYKDEVWDKGSDALPLHCPHQAAAVLLCPGPLRTSGGLLTNQSLEGLREGQGHGEGIQKPEYLSIR